MIDRSATRPHGIQNRPQMKNSVKPGPISARMQACMMKRAGTRISRAAVLTSASGRLSSMVNASAASPDESAACRPISCPSHVNGALVTGPSINRFDRLADVTQAAPDVISLVMPAAK